MTLISSFMLSCSSDDDVAPIVEKQNSLKVGDMKTELISGFFQTDEPQKDVYAYGIIFSDSEVNYVSGQPVPENNISNGIALEFFLITHKCQL
ncbi:MAG: hypothetical protein L0J60_07525 [Psychroflexus sp.]|nr:hypothetical protein [Psychroflexus sp.]